MSDYYDPEDLENFSKVGRFKPELFRKFMDWYTSSLAPGAVSAREKALIGLAVAHTIQCPYCIEAYTKACLDNGMNMEHMTEAVHTASAIRGGASLIHAMQAQKAADRLFM